MAANKSMGVGMPPNVQHHIPPVQTVQQQMLVQQQQQQYVGSSALQGSIGPTYFQGIHTPMYQYDELQMLQQGRMTHLSQVDNDCST